MRHFIANFLNICLALWLGGIVALAIFVMHLFWKSPELGSVAAPVLFHVFATYQLILAGLGLILTFALWRLVKQTQLRVLAILVLAAAALAIFSSGFLVPRIEQLQRDGLINTPAFQKFHSLSRTVYSTHALVLLAAIILLPIIIRRMDLPQSKSPRDQRDTASGH